MFYILDCVMKIIIELGTPFLGTNNHFMERMEGPVIYNFALQPGSF